MSAYRHASTKCLHAPPWRESVNAVADGLLADLARRFGERLEDVTLTIALDILQCIHVGLANLVTTKDENAPVPPAKVCNVLGEAPRQPADAQDVKKEVVHREIHVHALVHGINERADVIDGCSAPIQRHGQARAPHARLVRGHGLRALLDNIDAACAKYCSDERELVGCKGGAAAVHRFCPCSTTYDHVSHTRCYSSPQPAGIH